MSDIIMKLDIFKDKKLNLHFVNKSPIISMYIKFINENFNENDHLFVFIGKPLEEFEAYSNVIFTRCPFKLERLFIRANKIFFHGFFNKRLVQLLFLNSIFLKKSYWIVWGGDLYSYLKPKLSIKDKIYENIVRKFIIRNIGNIVTLVPGDFDLVKKVYKTKAKYYKGIYPIPIKCNDLDIVRSEFKKTGEITRVLIGNSASNNNNYLETIELLSKFRNENIEIYAIFSYGNEENYIKTVTKAGTAIFGEKFKPILDFLPIDEYCQFLNKMDIFISNHERQQGLGNIYIMSYLGKKIYLRNDTSMWNFFKKDIDLSIFDTLSIKNNSFDKLIEFKEENSINNVFNSKKLFKPKYAKEIWSKIC